MQNHTHLINNLPHIDRSPSNQSRLWAIKSLIQRGQDSRPTSCILLQAWRDQSIIYFPHYSIFGWYRSCKRWWACLILLWLCVTSANFPLQMAAVIGKMNPTNIIAMSIHYPNYSYTSVLGDFVRIINDLAWNELVKSHLHYQVPSFVGRDIATSSSIRFPWGLYCLNEDCIKMKIVSILWRSIAITVRARLWVIMSIEMPFWNKHLSLQVLDSKCLRILQMMQMNSCDSLLAIKQWAFLFCVFAFWEHELWIGQFVLNTCGFWS